MGGVAGVGGATAPTDFLTPAHAQEATGVMETANAPTVTAPGSPSYTGETPDPSVPEAAQ